jgi:molybdate transport system ATP-binding protein
MKISVDDIAIQLDKQRLFEHTRWVIEENQHWAVIGPNGAGKSTLVRAVARKVPIAQGRILYFFDQDREPEGRTFLHPDEVLTLSAETHQSFLSRFAEYHQARWQSLEGEDAPTVRDLLADSSPLPFAVLPARPEQAARREEVIAFLHLANLLDRKILNLSHGESRKVHLARLLARLPRLLILDDPYSGLDPESRQLLAKAIDAIIQHGQTQLLLVSARVEDIPPGIRHALLVNHGQVIAQGAREAVCERALQLTGQPEPGAKLALFQNNEAFASVVERYSAALEHNPEVVRSPEYIEMRAVSVTYGEVEVLKDINWSVRQGERWVLSGDNGAGKTTLLSLVLADNPQAYSNAIRLFGRERGTGESIWEIKRSIGWVSPELHIYYPKTASGLDVVCSGFFDSVGLYQRCSPEQVRLAEDWLRALGIEQLAGAQFKALSSGQQRLILLARAMVKNPPLLVLDEPCQALDDFHRQYFLELLRQLCLHTPISLVYVTHYQAEIPALMTHRLTLERGAVKYKGSI